MTDNQMLVSQMNYSFGDIFCTFLLIFIIVFVILFIKQVVSNLFKLKKDISDLNQIRKSETETALKGLNKTEKK